ncbi:MAG: glycosyltransferase [Moorea sp. SIO1F2]|uniref:glycosyltransferase family 2 protein n=1 Tax=Moorena sp. SIO1F2 TaxID=2607819 RepID=UPI0013B6ABB0|nr:glycosyltransferase [Moorena sp. SIO1F2]NET83836.1 glycosyltransferase [Moorena sp. SIO1F2]
MPKVSVVIPTYNAMTYLPKTIDSVFNQTYDDFEVIVVNDGSTDNTEQWISQIADPRVKLISQANQGLASAARNKGIANARGDYIAFIDADDLWEPTKLEKQLSVLEENPDVGLVYTWVAYINETGKPTGRVFEHHAEGNVWEKLVEHNIVECGSVAMVRRHCFESLGVFDQTLRAAEDWDMWLRIASRYPFAVVKEPLVRYRQHQNNKSKKYVKRLEDFRTIIEKAFQSAPFESLHLRNRSYGNINLCLAWKCLQSSEQDYKMANHFRRQALMHYPQLRFSREYIRLSIAIALMQWFGPEGYGKVLELAYSVRQRLSNVA